MVYSSGKARGSAIDRREHPRYPISLTLNNRIVNMETQQLFDGLACLCNVSKKGLCLKLHQQQSMSDDVFKKGTPLLIEVRLVFSGAVFFAQGTVAWSISQNDGAHTKLGLDLIHYESDAVPVFEKERNAREEFYLQVI
ncbi:MAG: PilZ domain-containing protein [Candidatus Auribacter fodinae]|jgi:hypothetical protein|uniref:PilZ domain-containing protein n=1 Tax=Candidatus Auribacter fodinae TaxID=2093366 RepID=A0A3A4RCF7_9BACT|nr:MAG: PilZ domain-containing protein [Candidatus Auribacter fodinae]